MKGSKLPTNIPFSCSPLYSLKRSGSMISAAVRVAAEVLVSQFRDHASARRALDEAFHDRYGSYTFHGAEFHRWRWRWSSPTGPAVELGMMVSNILLSISSRPYWSMLSRQSTFRDLGIYAPGALYLRKVAHTAQQGVGDTGRSTSVGQSPRRHRRRWGHSECLPNALMMRVSTSGS